MERLLFILLLVETAGVSLGFNRGWLQLFSTYNDGTPPYTVIVEPDKIKEDKARVDERLEEMRRTMQENIPPAARL